jgi:hypothetical protein
LFCSELATSIRMELLTPTLTMKTTVPPVIKKTSAICVVLEDEVIAYLDHTSIGMRLTTGRAVNRSMLIRAILTANLAYCLEWTHCLSEAEITAIIGRRLVATRANEMKLLRPTKPV